MLTVPVGFQLGFGVVLLLTMGIFKMFCQSYNAAMYSLIITVGHAFVNFLIRDGGLLNIFSAFGNEQSTAYPHLQYVMFVLTMILIAFGVWCLVLPNHPGGMPCLALAFSLMSSPAQLHSDNFPSTLILAQTGPICLLVAAAFCGAVASFLRSLAPTSLILLLTAWYLTEFAVSSKETLEYELSLITGFILGAMLEVTGRTMIRLCSSSRRVLQLQIFMGPIGFLYGIGLCWLFGWQMVLPSTWKDAYHIVPNIIAIFIIVQVERQRVYWASLELQGYPALLVSRSIKTLKEEKDFPLRFTLIDFAGDAVYHCTHHLFLSSLAIHLIAFNMERLEKEPEYIRRICYWVQSVVVHLKNPDPHIFIVGTHSKCLPADRVNFLSQTVSKALLSNEKFTQFIVGKPGSQNDVVFCVENSIPIRKDAQALLLRKTIMEVASSSFQAKRQVPIKWLKVSDFVSKFKSSSIDTCLLDKRTLLEKLRQEGIIEAEDVYEAEEFEEMIRFYDEIGEIKVMDDVVVLNLQALVQLVVELVELNCDGHELGIVHVSSLRRVWKHLTAESFLSTITLFERYDILCPISQEQYLVPLLIETVTKKGKQEVEETDHGASAFWDPADSDTVLYFKFYRFYPEAIFLRLLARCLSISQKTHDLGRDADRDVYRNMGRFYQGHDFYYKVELLCQSVDQNRSGTLSSALQGRGPHSLLPRLHKDLQQIRDRDFPYLNYTVGLPCSVCRTTTRERETVLLHTS
ncbi:probable serine/threonine-protein kinase pats1 [Branchiostoma floridae]|uniref:Probable serine/threonine-protein kinase pats1 n=1 Tax=Branchiostoma floridae TaxID=7739 RepID=A0A9J7N9S4_BRAFL|nr:probable serine/threonine-protein kinase pats1 [Branchiostoma floridae]